MYTTYNYNRWVVTWSLMYIPISHHSPVQVELVSNHGQYYICSRLSRFLLILLMYCIKSFQVNTVFQVFLGRVWIIVKQCVYNNAPLEKVAIVVYFPHLLDKVKQLYIINHMADKGKRVNRLQL